MAWNGSLERWKKYRYPALILALGVLLLLLPAGDRTGGADSPAVTPEQPAGAFDLEQFTREAETLLSSIQGAGPVKLLLTLDSDGSRDYLLEDSLSRSGDAEQAEHAAVLVTRNGDQEPVTVTRTYPGFRGAVAVCPGGGSPSVALQIKEALSSLTGLGMDKITVLKSG